MEQTCPPDVCYQETTRHSGKLISLNFSQAGSSRGSSLRPWEDINCVAQAERTQIDISNPTVGFQVLVWSGVLVLNAVDRQVPRSVCYLPSTCGTSGSCLLPTGLTAVASCDQRGEENGD